LISGFEPFLAIFMDFLKCYTCYSSFSHLIFSFTCTVYDSIVISVHVMSVFFTLCARLNWQFICQLFAANCVVLQMPYFRRLPRFKESHNTFNYREIKTVLTSTKTKNKKMDKIW